MSLEAAAWALDEAPVKNAVERLILFDVGQTAHEEGIAAEVNIPRLATLTASDEPTVRSALNDLVERGLILDVVPGHADGIHYCRLGMPSERDPYKGD